MEIPRARPHLGIEPRHGFEIVVEHIGAGRDDGLDRAVLAQEIGDQHLDRRVGRGGADRRDRPREMRGAAVVEIVAIDRGHDDMVEAEPRHRVADPLGLVRIERSGRPVATLQNVQARVQTAPRIITVACRSSSTRRYSGRPPPRTRCCRSSSRISRRVAWYSGDPGALTRIQAGLRGPGLSGRAAFSGWRSAIRLRAAPCRRHSSVSLNCARRSNAISLDGIEG